ncbi:hypothetical protein [Anaerofustis stercorihominis]|uniref:Uncharacterized protein n=1 Tax=Anaerofustis stercorihominis TaxID=214853 RepID=A0A3E3DX37_9FIRM|nr:hypothetical protein [Anaerofustis stercorihominis]RGD73813.1 hypothetical protein DW687_08535 [Anaerofustis stercorihominis]
MKIYQGSNDSLMFNLSGGFIEASNFYAVLVKSSKKLKEWERDDIDITNNILSLSLTQEETAMFPSGDAILSMKCFNSNSQVEFAAEIEIEIIARKDKGYIF